MSAMSPIVDKHSVTNMEFINGPLRVLLGFPVACIVRCAIITRHTVNMSYDIVIIEIHIGIGLLQILIEYY